MYIVLYSLQKYNLKVLNKKSRNIKFNKYNI